MSILNSRLVFLSALCLLSGRPAAAGDAPRGFFVEDLSRHPSVPAFYNIDAHKLQPITFRRAYSNFIDMAWDREGGRVFFSAHENPQDPYRVYLKSWPDGEEKIIYENPLGPFRFILSPDGNSMVLQVMGPSAWPILLVHDWKKGTTTLLGQGFSPDWSPDGQRVLFLQIPGSLPSYLAEYDALTSTTTVIMKEPVAEAIYSDAPQRIILKTGKQSQRCDEFQIWDRNKGILLPFSIRHGAKDLKHCSTQREINAFPGHRFIYFKESDTSTDFSDQTLVITDPDGARLKVLERAEWDPQAVPIEETTLVIGQDPLYIMSADGTGGTTEVPHARFIRMKK